MKINIGCGKEKREGYLAVDKSAKCKPDFIWDITKTPYPKEWEGCEEIRADNIFEHIEAYTLIKVINECHRVLESGGKLWMRVPELREGNLMPCFTDPTHINYFTEQTFEYYEEGHKRYKAFGKAYGIIPWKSRTQRSEKIFLIIELIK